MNKGKQTIEANLRKTAVKWKWLYFLQRIGIAAGIVTAFILLLGVGIHRGLFRSSSTVIALLVLLGLLAVIYVVILLVVVIDKTLERHWLAAKVEASQPEMLDRLNTLTHLERTRLPSTSKLLWFYPRILTQASDVLARKPTTASFPKTNALVANGVFILLLIATIYFYHRYDPWRRLQSESKVNKTAKVEKPFTLPPPDANALEQKDDWGEVKISDPGHDLKVTKVDAVQLQIEAAANQQLTNTSWYSTVNGGSEQTHTLPPASEPKYAVYAPVIYVDEFHLNEWDVMTYFAKAHTDRGNSYASEVYFLEVQPFREDILKMPGGQGGASYQMLSEMTDLISRQQHVIRQTHHHIQSVPVSPQMEEQDRGKLATAEKDLSDAAKHLYAELAVKMENKPVGEVLDQLAKAEKTLEKASAALTENQMSNAQNDERDALRQLVETRKIFQKTVSENPDAFSDKNDSDSEQNPTAETSKDKLKEISEFRNEEKATRDFVNEALKKQEALAEQAKGSAKTNYTNLAEQQRDILKSLTDFSEQHPQLFKNVTNEVAQSADAMQKAADALEKKSADARKSPENAAEKLSELAKTLNEEMAGQGLSDAYKLKKMLDQQIKKMDQIEQDPGNLKERELQSLVDRAKQTTDQLKKLADEKPTSEMFGPELSQALNSSNKQLLDSQLNRLAQSSSPETRKAHASDVSQKMQQVSKAFEQSQPQVIQQAKKNDALKQDKQNAFDKGMSQLQGLLGRLENRRPLSPHEQQKLEEEALENLQEGAQALYGSNEHAKKLLVMIERELKEKGHEVDIAALKKLMRELQDFSAEIKDPNTKTNEPVVTNIDPSPLPPAYRGRIEKYFRKLSESK